MSQTLLFKDGLRIGKSELELLQNIGKDGVKELTALLSASLPAVVQSTDSFTDLKVTVVGNGVGVAVGSALLSDGGSVTLSNASTLSVTDGTTNGKVVLTASTTPFALGTLAIGASDRYTLTYTAPSTGEVLTDYYQPNDYLRLYNAGTSTTLGTFRIESVSAGQLVLAEAVPGSTALSGLKHAPAGKFFPGYPAAGQTTDLLAFVTPALSVQSSSYTLGENDVLLATVTRSGSTVTVTDSRTVYRPRGITGITNDMIAANASIAESKIALSPQLLAAKLMANYWHLTAANEPATTAENIYVTRNGTMRKVLVDGDTTSSGATTPVFTNLAVTPSSATVKPGDTQALTASVTAQSGANVTYTFTSQNPAVATVTASGNAATVTGVAIGATTITVTATAPALGSYAATTMTTTVTLTVSTAAAVLTSISINPATVGMGVTSSPTTVTATVTSPVSPTVTWLWERTNADDGSVQVSGTTTATITLTPLKAGSCKFKVTATAPSSGNYTGNSLTSTELTVTVTAGLVLKAEPGFKVTCTRPNPNSDLVAVFNWGIRGTYTLSGLTASVAMHADDAWVTVSQNSLADLAFLDNTGTRYTIASNTAKSNSSFSVTLTKAASDPSPAASGSCFIRSAASQYDVDVLTTDGTSYKYNGVPFDAGLLREYSAPATNVTLGTTYRCVLTASNGSATPSTFPNAQNVQWGAATSSTTITIPSTWVTSSSTYTSVVFSWAPLYQQGYDPTTMDYYVQWSINGGTYSAWTRVSDDALNSPSLSYTVFAASSSSVVFRVKITDLTGTTSINNVAYDAQVTATTNTIITNSSPMEKTYPITMTNSSSWVEIIQGSGRYILPLVQYDGTPTSFNTQVQINQIDLSLVKQNLAQTTGTAMLKLVIYPTANPGYAVFSDLLTEGITNFVMTSFGNNAGSGAQLAAGVNEDITVALEYAASGNPNTLDPTGLGYAKVYFAVKTGDQA